MYLMEIDPSAQLRPLEMGRDDDVPKFAADLYFGEKCQLKVVSAQCLWVKHGKTSISRLSFFYRWNIQFFLVKYVYLNFFLRNPQLFE